MRSIAVLSLVLTSLVFAFPQDWYGSYQSINKRVLTTDNTCGGIQGLTCDPALSRGGSCCSSKGYCGNSPDYCGTGCQAAFGTCGAGESTAVSISSVPVQTPSTQGSKNSNQPVQSGCVWVVDNDASFTFRQAWDFSQYSGPSVPSGLTDPEINIASQKASMLAQKYPQKNVAVADGVLQLKVPGGQTTAPILGAQVSTSDADILFASVRTWAQISPVAGVCHGFFFWQSDTQEVDIEVLTGHLSQGAHFTNQPDETTTKPLPSDATSTMHEYRIDWHQDGTKFYIDGEYQATLGGPSQPGSWVWNNWSNGDPGWTGSMPTQDSVLMISRIEMYYNRTGSKGTCK